MASQDARSEEPLLNFAQTLLDYKAAFGEKSATFKKFIASITQGEGVDKSVLPNALMQVLSDTKERIQKERLSLSKEDDELQEETQIDPAVKEKIQQLQSKEDKIRDALYLVKNRIRDFSQGSSPMSYEFIDSQFAKSGLLAFKKHHPLIKDLTIDQEKEMLVLSLHDDVASAYEEANTGKKELIQSLIYKELARVNRDTQEEFKPQNQKFVSPLSTLQSSKSFLVLDTRSVLLKTEQKAASILESYEPKIIDLQKEQYPVIAFEDYKRLSEDQKDFHIVLYSPGLEGKFPVNGFKNDSQYVIFKDFYKIYRKYAQVKSESQEIFNEDLKQLSNLFSQQGYTAYPGSVISFAKEFSDDLIFELSSVLEPVLAASREKFELKGSKTFALLEYSDVRQRILTMNQIESKEQEDLLRSKDLFNAAQIDPTQRTFFDAPKPIRSTIWNNLVISIKKYFRDSHRNYQHVTIQFTI
jgi:SecD/SecF fusion protein